MNGYEALSSFRRYVPKSYYDHIRSLFICFKPSSGGDIDQATDLSDILSSTTKVESLSLHLIGTPSKRIIPLFKNLSNLKSLHIGNCGDSNRHPLYVTIPSLNPGVWMLTSSATYRSERLVVSIALEIPLLQELSLERITRSKMHVIELRAGTIPTVSGDQYIEDHPIVGSRLSLPSLLGICTLQRLRIRETHLGDPLWMDATCLAPLSALDLGSPGFSRTTDAAHMETIVRKVAEVYPINRLAVFTGLGWHQTNPLDKLRHLEFNAYFPIDSIVETLSKLSDSPIETIVVQYLVDKSLDDVGYLCESLKNFLNRRVERGSTEFHRQLKKLFIDLVPYNERVPLSSSQLYKELGEDQRANLKSLEEFCRKLRLECGVVGVNASNNCCFSTPGLCDPPHGPLVQIPSEWRS